MDNIRKIHHVCRIRLIKTFTTPRFYVALLWVLLEFQGTASGIRAFCKTSGIDAAFWILPFLTHRCFAQVMIALGALLLFCDAPFLEPDSSFQILRAGRKNWFWGNVLYLWILSLIYTVCLAILPVLLVFPYVGWENGWGKVLGLLTTDAAYNVEMEAGQGLIGTARSERDGTLIFAPAAGTVVAQLEWETNQSIPLAETLSQLTGENKTNYRLFFAGHSVALSPSSPDGDGLCRTRHLRLEVFGLPLPCAVEETTFYAQQQKTLYRTEAQALTLARLQGLRALYDAFPDADILARREECTVQEETLHYNAVYTVAADICT